MLEKLLFIEKNMMMQIRLKLIDRAFLKFKIVLLVGHVWPECCSLLSYMFLLAYGCQISPPDF